MVLSPAEDRSPWNKFLHFLPAPFSHLASKVDRNALAAAAFLITHCSRETQTSAQLRLLSFPFPFEKFL